MKLSISFPNTQVEKQKNELLKDLEQLQDRIEETGGVAMAQTELSKKREAELQKMQADAQAQAEEHDRTVADMRKKHQQSVNGLQEQVRTLNCGQRVVGSCPTYVGQLLVF